MLILHWGLLFIRITFILNFLDWAWWILKENPWGAQGIFFKGHWHSVLPYLGKGFPFNLSFQSLYWAFLPSFFSKTGNFFPRFFPLKPFPRLQVTILLFLLLLPNFGNLSLSGMWGFPFPKFFHPGLASNFTFRGILLYYSPSFKLWVLFKEPLF